MDKNGEKDVGGGNDGQTVTCTEDEGRDGQVVTSTDNKGKDNTTVECAHDERKDGQTVTSFENDDNCRATVKSTDDDKNGRKVSSTGEGGQTDVNNSEKGKTIIEQAEIALRENKKKEALDLYKRGIQLLLQGLKVEPLTDGEKNKLKQNCADYLSIAEKLKKELVQEVKGDMSSVYPEDKDDTSSVDPEDKDIVDYVNDLIKTVRPNITLDDVCGCQEAKDHLKESFILPALYPQLFTGRRIPWRGTFLFGAPGTGKTMIGRALAGMCPHLGFIHVATSDLISKYIGEPEKIVKYLFKKVQELQPCILFLDDVGCILYEEEYNDRRLRTELLVQIQGIGQDSDGVHILLSASEPWKIQRSIHRRLEKRIYIRMPEKEARKQIIRKNLESVKHNMNDEDLDGLAEKLEGYTGSDIICVVRDATMEPVREIQKATHFRKVKKDSSDTADDDKDFQYHVCTADDPDSIAMTLDDILVLDSDQLFERPLNKDDMMKSLSRSKPSIDEEYLKKMDKFVQDVHNHEHSS